MYWLGDRFSSLLLLSETWNYFVWNALRLQQSSPPKQAAKPIVLVQVITHMTRINQFVQETLKLQRFESTKREADASWWLWEVPRATELTCSSRALSGASKFPGPGSTIGATKPKERSHTLITREADVLCCAMAPSPHTVSPKRECWGSACPERHEPVLAQPL